MKVLLVFVFVCVLNLTKSHRISFTRCENVGWTCVEGKPNDIRFNCNSSNNTNYIVYVKDFYTPNITSVTIQNCPNLKLYLDCPLLRSPSQLETFTVRDCGRLEFSHSDYTSTQLPATTVLDNIGFIQSIPTDTIHDPRTTLEKRCVGKADGMHNIVFSNSNIGVIEYKAINNVTTPKGITFQNVSIASIANYAIEVHLESRWSLFKMHASNLDIQSTSVNVLAETVIFTSNLLNIKTNGLNTKAHLFKFEANTINEIESEGIIVAATTISITQNQIDKIRSNGLAKIQCANTERLKSIFVFSNNSIQKVEPLSLDLNLNSCLFNDISIKDNRMDCRCKNWATNVDRRQKTERSHIMFVTNGNTCLGAPCTLPVEIVEVMQRTGTCHLDLDPKLMCLMYNDSKTAYEIEEITTERPTFYIVKATSISRDTKEDSIAAIKKDIQKDASLKHDCNITNATSCVTIPITFDDTKSFVDTLRRTNSSKVKIEAVQTPYKEIIPNNTSINCVNGNCTKDLSSNKKKALEFYKYLYLQLRSKNGTNNFKNSINPLQ